MQLLARPKPRWAARRLQRAMARAMQLCWRMQGYCGFSPWFTFPIVGLLLLGLMFATLFGSARSSGRAASFSERGPNREPPLEILKRRYAQGEITKDQFDQIRRDLASSQEGT